MDKILIDVIQSFSSFSALVPLGLYLFFRRNQDKTTQVLALILVFSFLTDAISTVIYALITRGVIERFPYQNGFIAIYHLIEFSLLLLIYYRLTGERRNKLFLGLFIAFSAFWLFSVISNGLFKKDMNINTTMAIIFMGFSFYFFHYLLKTLGNEKITSLPGFWFNVGVLLYFSGNFLLFLSAEYIVNKSYNTFMAFWGLHNFLNFSRSLLFAVAIYKQSRLVRT